MLFGRVDLELLVYSNTHPCAHKFKHAWAGLLRSILSTQIVYLVENICDGGGEEEIKEICHVHSMLIYLEIYWNLLSSEKSP